MKLWWILIFNSIFSSQWAFAASCCGGGSAFPGVITGDFKSQVTTTMSGGQVVADAKQNGYFSRSSNESEKFKTLSLNYAQRLDEWNQFSLSLPLVTSRSKQLGGFTEEDSGIGDISISLANEFLPELTYSKWKPRGFVYSKLLIPVAPSLYDAENTLKTDSRGEGVYGLALGTLFVKVVGDWDLLGGVEYKYRFSRSFPEIHVEPGSMANALAGAGYNFKKYPWRVGLSLQYQHTGAAELNRQGLKSSTEAKRVWDTSLSVNYLYEKEWMFAAIYTDQTLWGPAENTTFERQLSVQLQKRWSM